MSQTDHLVLAVAALPPELQTYMARCTLSGWRFWRGPSSTFWYARRHLRPGTVEYTSGTLRLLLEKMIDNREMTV